MLGLLDNFCSINFENPFPNIHSNWHISLLKEGMLTFLWTVRFGVCWWKLSPTVVKLSSCTLMEPVLPVQYVGLESSSQRYNNIYQHNIKFLSVAPCLQVWNVHPFQDCGFGNAGEGVCIPCEEGRFSADTGVAPCMRCTKCHLLNRQVKSACSSISNALCGHCLPGWVTPTVKPWKVLIVSQYNAIVCAGIMNSGAWQGKLSCLVCLVTAMTQPTKSVCF